MTMWDFLILPALLAAWFALFRWVLPALGVATCLSGTCAAVPHVEPGDDGPVSAPPAPGVKGGR
jgi:hypothetical protein